MLSLHNCVVVLFGTWLAVDTLAKLSMPACGRRLQQSQHRRFRLQQALQCSLALTVEPDILQTHDLAVKLASGKRSGKAARKESRTEQRAAAAAARAAAAPQPDEAMAEAPKLRKQKGGKKKKPAAKKSGGEAAAQPAAGAAADAADAMEAD